MDEAPSVFEFLTMGGPIWIFGWLSLAAVIITGCILLWLPPRRSRRVSLVDMYAACLHIQLLIFILCVPLSLAAVAYMTLRPIPGVIARDMLIAAGSVLVNLIISGAFLVSVSLRHRTTPAIEWMPAISVLMTILSLFAAWECRMTGETLAEQITASRLRGAEEVSREAEDLDAAPLSR